MLSAKQAGVFGFAYGQMPADDVIFRQSTDHEEGVSVETEKKTLRKWILLILVLLIPITAVLVALRISQAASREKEMNRLKRDGFRAAEQCRGQAQGRDRLVT